MQSQAVNNIVAHSDMSFLNLLSDSDWMTTIIYILLIGASIWSWAIIFEKIILIRKVKWRIKRFEDEFWSGKPLGELYKKIALKQRDPMSAIFVAALKEWKKNDISTSKLISVNQRIEQVARITLDREITEIETRMTFLSSTGSVCPFLGLFGTVWGIIDCFHQIGITGNTSITIIAPGIGEALYTTALGLIAAIPAVLAYNKISTDIERLARKLENFAIEFTAILTRQTESSTIEGHGKENA